MPEPTGEPREPWVIHEWPERPLTFGACFCPCKACRAALEGAARHAPELPVGVKFGLAERVVVEAGVLGADGCAERDLVRRFGRPGDWVRELWVARGFDDALSPAEERLLAALARGRRDGGDGLG